MNLAPCQAHGPSAVAHTNFNLKLSQRRADAVREYLQTKSVWINSGAVSGNPFVLR